MLKLVTKILASSLFLLPAVVRAAESKPLPINTGVPATVTVVSIAKGFVDILLLWSGYVALALFLLGALMMVGSGGSDTTLSGGKKIIKAAIIGLAIILASWMIISTVVFLISGSAS